MTVGGLLEVLLEELRAQPARAADMAAVLAPYIAPAGAVYTAPELLTVDQAAELAQCHAETIRRAIRARRLTASRVGTQFRIARVDLNAWLAAPPADDRPAHPSSNARRRLAASNRRGAMAEAFHRLAVDNHQQTL